ncbi:golgin IMH1, putative [Pediculus humanus corporis]|uniref:Golgin IMH1, putative n=1 Tax=Pediculus humanus subsp. corporis TaxID=121224 RepID=E0W002_PEDHC|nr:golgin IMH1, putative [Pediculus humanus corporis]EEB18958.1 golgin IMH1, putative [Pediculus humanus corporis]
MSKQSPVEELLRQADQLISNQRPKAEVYAAMAESLGSAWKDINNLLEERRQILEMNVNYKRQEENCWKKIENLESLCLNATVPYEIETVKQLLTKLHSGKRAMLESLMATLQEGKFLHDKLNMLAKKGTLDSRPDNIKSNAEKAVSQVEHWLESLHDKRKQMETLWQTRKLQIEHCLGLAILASELLDVENVLKLKKEKLLKNDNLGDSKSTALILLDELMKILGDAQNLQEKTLKITNSTEKLAATSSGHFAGEEAISQSYAVLNECAEFLNCIDKREEILKKTVEFFNAADIAFNKLDSIENKMALSDLSDSSTVHSQIYSELIDAMEESTEPAILLGTEILNTVGHDTYGAIGVKNTLNELKSRRINLEGICTRRKEEKVQASQKFNEFLEKHNEIYSWLITTVESFLQSHQDMGTSLSASQDYLNSHVQLLEEFRIKEIELKSLLSTISSMRMNESDSEYRKDLNEKMKFLQEHWMELKFKLENRIDLANVYTGFHGKAQDLTNRFDSLEDDFKRKKSTMMMMADNDVKQRQEEEEEERKIQTAQELYVQLCHNGKNFTDDLEKIHDPGMWGEGGRHRKN